jgi:hypothetical protein
MKTLITFSILLVILLSGCKESSNNTSSLSASEELKRKELELKEKELEIKEKELLDKKENDVAGDYPESSLITLQDEDLRNKDAWELRVMRNEIFARHGYIFKSEDMRSHFLNSGWYIPRYENVEVSLTSIEKANIELIKRYEKYL